MHQIYDKKRENGITLIALVITIIVLLILAAISIGTLTGKNGLITQANNARTLTIHQHVYEELKLKVAEYVLENQLGKYDNNLISYLLKNGYIEEMDGIEGYIINVPTLTGSKLKLGNGTDGKKDVYKLEEIKKDANLAKIASKEIVKIGKGNTTEKEYNIIYYGKSKEDDYKLGTLTDGDEPTISEENNKKLTIKVYDENENTLLPGATISIYKNAECTDELIKNINIDEGTYVYTPIPTKGTYYVVIDKAPDGYNGIEGAIEYTIGDEENPTWEIRFSKGATLPSSGGNPSLPQIRFEGYNGQNLNVEENINLHFSTEKYTEDTYLDIKLYLLAEFQQKNGQYSYEYYQYTDEFQEFEGEDIFSINFIKDNELLARMLGTSSSCTPAGEAELQGGATENIMNLPAGIYFMSVSVDGDCVPTLCSIVYPQKDDDIYFYDINITFIDCDEKYKKGSLEINSIINDFYDVGQSLAGCIYNIEGWRNGEKVVSLMRNCTFTDRENKILVESIPAGTEINVEIIYMSPTCKEQGNITETTTILVNQTSNVSFEYNYDETVNEQIQSGCMVTNFVYNIEEQSWKINGPQKEWSSLERYKCVW